MSFHKCKFTENLTCTWLFRVSVDLSEIEIGLFCITADADGFFCQLIFLLMEHFPAISL